MKWIFLALLIGALVVLLVVSSTYPWGTEVAGSDILETIDEVSKKC